MADHATWYSFPAEKAALLRAYLQDARPLDENECAGLLAILDQYEAPDSKDQVFRNAAEDQPFVRDGECEIDDHAVVSASDEGAYVMAWVWVSNEDAGIFPEDDDDEQEANEPGE